MIKNTNNDIPEAVLKLMPWYSTGKLSAEDQTLFEKALIIYPLLEELLRQELQLIETVSANKALLDSSALSPQDERLKSVLNMLDVVDAQNQSTRHSVDSRSTSLLPTSSFNKLKNIFASLVSNLDSVSQYSRTATSVGILALSVAVLTAFVSPLFTETSDFVPASAAKQLNNKQTSSFMGTTKTALLVGFNGTSVELGNNKVLKGRILKVETFLNKEGVYQVSFNKTLKPDEIKQIVDGLLKQKELIWFAGEEF